MNELPAVAVAAWLGAGVLALCPHGRAAARALILAGLAASLLAAIAALTTGTALPAVTPWDPVHGGPAFRLSVTASWLYGFGAAAALAAVLARPTAACSRFWHAGLALTLLGALGVFGIQDGIGFLVSWEIMSMGGAFMLLTEYPQHDDARPVLLMLGILELGFVALVAAILWFSGVTGTSALGAFPGAIAGPDALVAGILLLVGFGAKLGLLPFYEWFPAAYRGGSGATGAILSGIVLNAAYFALARGLIDWIDGEQFALAYMVLAVGVFTAILTALYAFQQNDWRGLLAFSSAENAAIGVVLVGSSLLFHTAGLPRLAGLAWVAGLLHMAGHTLAKTTMFLACDRTATVTGSYDLRQSGMAARAPWLGLGALVAGMSLAAIPPTPGFIGEWFGFQTLFQGFQLDSVGGRITLALSGAGLALTGAIALATFAKAIGLGLLGRATTGPAAEPGRRDPVVPAMGALVLLLAIGMPWWIAALDAPAMARFGSTATTLMRHDWLLVPLSADFAFISPPKLAIAIPLYAALPLLAIFLAARGRTRRVPVWYGGLHESPTQSATTALTFSNALRRYYSLVYRPRTRESREHTGLPYFVHRLVFTYDLAPIFGPYLFAPCVRFVRWFAERLSILQSGHLNFYLSLIGLVLIVILALMLV